MWQVWGRGQSMAARCLGNEVRWGGRTLEEGGMDRMGAGGGQAERGVGT